MNDNPLFLINRVFGEETAKKIFTFDIEEEEPEPEEVWGPSSKWPYEDPNQLKLDLQEITLKLKQIIKQNGKL